MMQSPDLHAIRVVTQRYRGLQGLRPVVWALGPILVGSVALPASSLEVQLLMLTVCIAQGFADAYLDHYYARRFGIASAEPDILVKVMTIALFGAAALILVLGWAVWIVPSMIAITHLWIVIRDYPQRSYYLIGVIGASGAAIMLLTSQGQDDRTAWWAVMLVAASIIPPGLLDHRLLLKTLRRSAAGEDLDSPSIVPGLSR